MTVRVRAGTTVADLDDALGEHGQCVAVPAFEGATVGGVVAVGHSGIRRLGWGPVRDTVLEVRYVSADGCLIKGGGPTVKNVSGYDIPRLFVGSLGTLGIIAELVLRTRPVPPCERWFTGEADPFALLHRLHRPGCVMWDGTTTWLLLDGHPDDVDAQGRRGRVARNRRPAAVAARAAHIVGRCRRRSFGRCRRTDTGPSSPRSASASCTAVCRSRGHRSTPSSPSSSSG